MSIDGGKYNVNMHDVGDAVSERSWTVYLISLSNDNDDVGLKSVFLSK
jgi:hypothetical protein